LETSRSLLSIWRGASLEPCETVYQAELSSYFVNAKTKRQDPGGSAFW
jgi:hypothetical protein